MQRPYRQKTVHKGEKNTAKVSIEDRNTLGQKTTEDIGAMLAGFSLSLPLSRPQDFQDRMASFSSFEKDDFGKCNYSLICSPENKTRLGRYRTKSAKGRPRGVGEGMRWGGPQSPGTGSYQFYDLPACHPLAVDTKPCFTSTQLVPT